MTWNKEEAISWARQHVQPHSTGYCARYVARAIEEGGLLISHANAHDFGGSLRGPDFMRCQAAPHPKKGTLR